MFKQQCQHPQVSCPWYSYNILTLLTVNYHLGWYLNFENNPTSLGAYNLDWQIPVTPIVYTNYLGAYKSNQKTLGLNIDNIYYQWSGTQPPKGSRQNKSKSSCLQVFKLGLYMVQHIEKRLICSLWLYVWSCASCEYSLRVTAKLGKPVKSAIHGLHNTFLHICIEWKLKKNQ
jgi:hypothetical protein